MRTMHPARWAAALLLPAVLWGCGKSALTAPEPDSNLTTQQANVLALQFGVLTSTTGLDVPAGVPATFAVHRDGSGFRRAPALWDTTITNENGTLSLSVNFYDSTGTEQPVFDEQTTDHVHLGSWLHAEFSDPSGAFLLGSAGTLELTGLRPSSDRQTANGARADTVHWEYQDDTTSVNYTTRATGAVRTVVRLKPVDSGYPISGSIRWTLDVDVHIVAGAGTADQTLRGTAVVTFNGTRYASLVLNSRHAYTLDLDTGEVTPVAS